MVVAYGYEQRNKMSISLCNRPLDLCSLNVINRSRNLLSEMHSFACQY